MNKSMNINALIEQCADMLLAKGYNEASIRGYQDKWQRYVIPFVKSQGTSLYTKEVGERFLKLNLSGKSPSTRKSYNRCITILTEYVETGTITRRLKTMPSHPLEGPIGEIAKEFIEYANRELRLRDLTLVAHRRQLSSFICGLSVKGIDAIDDISEKDILDFLNLSVHAQQERLYALRSFFKYLQYTHRTDREFGVVFRQYKFVRQAKLPSVYTEEEISTIIDYAKRQAQSAVGKRDYAIALLACKLGIRSSDIRFLQFSQIDWEKRVIHFQQFKTGVDLLLPLLHDVGEAIIEYIQTARPKSDKRYIFLSDNAPYDVISATSISHRVGNLIKESGVVIGRRHMGSHALRHSLATHLLEQGIGLPVISEVLGHTETSSTMYYIGVSREVLLSCALPVPLVPKHFYTQRGGIFYV